MTSLPLEPVTDVAAAASRCAGKSLQSEGIPMVLALEDMADADGAAAPDAQPGPAGPAAAEFGAVLAERLVSYRGVLFPSAGTDEYWPVHDALVVVADAHGPQMTARPGGAPAEGPPGPGGAP